MSNYFRELTLNLQHAGFVVKPETEDVADDYRSAALDRANSITKATAEYMSQMAAAPQLTTNSLTGDYRLLADFNGVVQAGLYSITDEQGKCLQSIINQIELSIPNLGKLLDQEQNIEVPEDGGMQFS